MNLISKKDLLAITGISYGQLYRWKRERLIPEEWFIKQSAYTGQETFFPREQILSRIKSILDLKDDYSLEELAKILSPGASSSQIAYNDFYQMEEMDRKLIERLPEYYHKEFYELMEVALLVAISKLMKTSKFTTDKAVALLNKSMVAAMSYSNVNVTCTVFEVGGEFHTLFHQISTKAEFDCDIRIVDQIHMNEIVDNLKIKYKHLFTK